MFTMHCTCHVISHDKLLYFHICTSRKHVTVPSMAVYCSSLYVLSNYAVQIFSAWLSEGSICPRYYSRYNFYFDIGQTLPSILSSLYLEFFGFFLYYISVSWNFSVYWQASSLLSITDYNNQDIFMDCSICFYLLIA